jgi:hypothetical protein
MYSHAKQMNKILTYAKLLKSEDGENPEYDRGVCELAADLLGLPLGDGGAVQVGKQIGCKNMEEWYK